MLSCQCPEDILNGINKKIACIGEDLLNSKKYGFKRKFSYDDLFPLIMYKKMITSNCIITCNIKEKIKIII